MQRNYLAINAALTARVRARALTTGELRARTERAGTPFKALVLKEYRTLLGIPSYAFNCLFGYLFMLVIAVALSVIGLKEILLSRRGRWRGNRRCGIRRHRGLRGESPAMVLRLLRDHVSERPRAPSPSRARARGFCATGTATPTHHPRRQARVERRARRRHHSGERARALRKRAGRRPRCRLRARHWLRRVLPHGEHRPLKRRPQAQLLMDDAERPS